MTGLLRLGPGMRTLRMGGALPQGNAAYKPALVVLVLVIFSLNIYFVLIKQTPLVVKNAPEDALSGAHTCCRQQGFTAAAAAAAQATAAQHQHVHCTTTPWRSKNAWRDLERSSRERQTCPG